MNRWVHVDAKGVAYPLDAYVLIKRLVVAILGQQPDVALAVGDLVVAGRIVGHVGVRHILNVTHHAVKHLGDLNVGVVVGWDDLAGRAVLALLVGHHAHMLGQLVDGQTRTGVDRLALHGAACR